MPDDITATKIIPDLETALVERVKLYLKLKVLGKANPIYTHNGANLYRFGDDGEGFYALVHNGKLVYFVRHRRIRYGGAKLGRQVLLWRDPNSDTVTNGFARLVFFKILLPRYGALIADKEQTRNGSAFWRNAMGNALDKGLHVYFLDRRGSVKLTKLESEEAIDAAAPDLWGTTPAHLYTFAVVSEKPLALRTSRKK
jgi:hypothetical protein